MVSPSQKRQRVKTYLSQKLKRFLSKTNRFRFGSLKDDFHCTPVLKHLADFSVRICAKKLSFPLIWINLKNDQSKKGQILNNCWANFGTDNKAAKNKITCYCMFYITFVPLHSLYLSYPTPPYPLYFNSPHPPHQ